MGMNKDQEALASQSVVTSLMAPFIVTQTGIHHRILFLQRHTAEERVSVPRQKTMSRRSGLLKLHVGLETKFRMEQKYQFRMQRLFPKEQST
jgi:hypothetical protein